MLDQCHLIAPSLLPASVHYLQHLSALLNFSTISSIWVFSRISGGESATMSPVTRISSPVSKQLIADLDRNNIITKQRQAKTRAASGGIPFTYGPLAYLLKNRVYLGEMGHKDLWFSGEQAAIVDRKLFGDVQTLLTSNAVHRSKRRSQSEALLPARTVCVTGSTSAPRCCAAARPPPVRSAASPHPISRPP
jgi:hypothetical protein